MAVESNWSAFVEGAVEIKIPRQMVCLVRDPVSNSDTFSRKCIHIHHGQVDIRPNSSYFEHLMTACSM